MSALIPSAALAVVGYLGAEASHALISAGLLAAAAGIVLATAPAPLHIHCLSQCTGAWLLVLSVGLLAGTASGAASRAAETLARRIATVPFSAVEGNAAETHHSASGTRVKFSQWRGRTPQLDLVVSAPATVYLRHSGASAGNRVAVSGASGDRLPAWAGNRSVAFRSDSAEISGSASVRGRVTAALSRMIDRAAGGAAPVLRALVLGDTSTLDPQRLLQFRRAGVMHLLALSGMHLAVLALLAGGVGRALGGRTVSIVTTAAVIVLYLALIGPRSGLVRAALLIGISGLAKTGGRRMALVSALALTFVVHLVIDPPALREVGFLLSYLSLLGIATLAPLIIYRFDGRIPRMVLAPLAAGLGAQLTTLPVVLLVFENVYPLAAVASLALAPLITVLMAGGLLASIAATVVRPLVPLVRTVLERGDRLVGSVAAYFSAGPVVSIEGFTVTERGIAIAVCLTVSSLVVCGGLVLFFRVKYHPEQLWRGRI